MTLKSDLEAYQKRWVAVEAFQREERRTASIALRWQQLNSAYGMAKELGLLKPDPSEMGIFQRWAKLKGKMESCRPSQE